MTLPNLGAHPRATDMGTTDQREIRSNERDYLLDGSAHGSVDIDVSAGGTVTPTAEERLANSAIRFTGSPSVDPVLNIVETARQICLDNTTAQDILTTADGGDILLENGVDSIQLEDGSGNLLLDTSSVLLAAGLKRIYQKDGTTYKELGREGLQTGALLHDGAVDPTGNFDWDDKQISQVELKDVSQTVDTPSSSSGTLILNMALANVFDVTLTEAVTTITFSNIPATANTVAAITLIARQDATGTWAITFPASVQFPQNVSSGLLLEDVFGSEILLESGDRLLQENFLDDGQTLDPDAVDIYVLKTFDAGTTWYATIAGLDLK